MAQQKGWRQDLRDFLMRGNVIDLAVAIVIGVAFAAVISSFVDGIVMPLIAAIVGKPSFDALTLSVGDGIVRYGSFLTQVVNFAIVGSALFVAVKAYQRMQKPKEIDVTEPATPEETQLLREIRDLLVQQRVQR